MKQESLFLIVILLFFAVSSCVCDNTEEASEDAAAPDNSGGVDCKPESYDFIVVGVGHAGSVITSRLAESGKYTVMGLEPGPRTHRDLNGTDYVAASFTILANGTVQVNRPFTRFDLPGYYPSIYTAPTPYTEYQINLNGKNTSAYVAQLLGGSGAHNGMIWARFTKANIDSWGVQGWSYEDVLPYYIKSENASGTRVEAINPTYHGVNGPIGLSDVPTGLYFESVPYFNAACIRTGLPNNTDFNGPFRVGCGTHTYNIKRGVRNSAAQAYLPTALKKGNLVLNMGAYVTKILIQNRNGNPTAVGVEYELNGQTKQVMANKEVIISASAILSPKILMLSGIGPGPMLRSLGIPVVVDNPNVGKNLGNNMLCPGRWEYPNATNPNEWRISQDAQEYAVNGTGPLGFVPNFAFAYSCSNGTNGTSPTNGTNCSDPDVMIGSTAGIYEPGTIAPSISLNVESALPKSRGIITLTSTDPHAPPYVNMPPYQNPADINSTIYGLQLLRRIKNTYPANQIFGAEVTPGPSVQTYQQFYNYVVTSAYPSAHWVGSCKLGNPGDPTAVVDNQLRVMGVKNLRVGDASILPQLNSHPQASVVMVGEKISAMILQTYGN